MTGEARRRPSSFPTKPPGACQRRHQRHSPSTAPGRRTRTGWWGCAGGSAPRQAPSGSDGGPRPGWLGGCLQGMSPSHLFARQSLDFQHRYKVPIQFLGSAQRSERKTHPNCFLFFCTATTNPQITSCLLKTKLLLFHLEIVLFVPQDYF